MWFDLQVFVTRDKEDKDNSRIFLPLDLPDWQKTITEDVESWGMYCIRIQNNPEAADGRESLVVQILPTAEDAYAKQGQYFGFSMKQEEATQFAQALMFAANQLNVGA